jgi:hypothetical protein
VGVGAFAVRFAVPPVYPVLLAAAVIVPDDAALTLMTALPEPSVVPVPVALPLKIIVAPLTAALLLVTVKVTEVAVPTVTVVGVAVTLSVGVGVVVGVGDILTLMVTHDWLFAVLASLGLVTVAQFVKLLPGGALIFTVILIWGSNPGGTGCILAFQVQATVPVDSPLSLHNSISCLPVRR